MKLLYFAWVRQKVGQREETLAMPDGVATVGDLMRGSPNAAAAMRMRSPIPSDCARRSIRSTSPSTRACRSEDEVAFFPPVTGG